MYVLEFVLWLPLMVGFYICTSFLAATPVANLELHGKALPANWEAAVFNHGKYLQGFIIGNHPAVFALGVLLTLGAAVAIYPVRKAQAKQAAEASTTAKGRFQAANIVVMVALAITSLLAMTQVFVGVNPG